MKMKKALLLLSLLVLALLFSGCNLIGTDYKLQADRNIAELAKTYELPVAQFDGGELSFGESILSFYNSYEQTASMYQMFGMEMSHEEEHSIIESTLQAGVQNKIVCMKFDEMQSLDDETLSRIESEAQSIYDENLSYAAQNAEGSSKAERSENARVLLYANGLDYDSIYNILISEKKLEMLDEALANEITEVSDEELQAAYDSAVEAQKQSYIDGYSFESSYGSSSETIYWVPEGYRSVKHILLIPSEEIKQAYMDASHALQDADKGISDLQAQIVGEEGDASELQAQLDEALAQRDTAQAQLDEAAKACLADVQAKLDEVYAALEAGESFDSLMEVYGEDPGMQSEPAKNMGYAVSSFSAQWDTHFRDGAMALEEVGAYSAEPVVGSSGVHIIYYASDVPSGEIALEDVHEQLYADTLAAMQSTHKEETISAWVSAANPVYDTEGFEALLG